MGTIYGLLNKTKKESILIGGHGQKLSELMCEEYSNFVVYMLILDWRGDHVIFISDNNSFNYGEEFESASDVSDKYWGEYKEFLKEQRVRI